MDEHPPTEPAQDEADDVRGLVHRIVGCLVDTPEEVEVDYELVQAEVQYLIRVAPGEAGQVIGKRGRNFSALRELIGCIAAKSGMWVRIDIDG